MQRHCACAFFIPYRFAISAIKADPPIAATPVVVVTVLPERGRGFALGASDYLTKPIDVDQLAAILKKHNGRATL